MSANWSAMQRAFGALNALKKEHGLTDLEMVEVLMHWCHTLLRWNLHQTDRDLCLSTADMSND